MRLRALRICKTGQAIALGLCCFLGLPAAVLQAQQLSLGEQVVRSPVLTVDRDRLFNTSQFGKRIMAEVQADGAALEAENRRIEAELAAEEKDLTERRPDMAPDDFRALADAFDAKVQRTRSEQAEKARALNERVDRAQQQFVATAGPVLERMMQEAGAAVIMEQRSVFMAANIIDITAQAVSQIDAEIGDGAAIPTDVPLGGGTVREPTDPNAPPQE